MLSRYFDPLSYPIPAPSSLPPFCCPIRFATWHISPLLVYFFKQLIAPEHKTRRAQLERSMACPGPYDGFWTFNRNKTGYSGVCTYVDSTYCVPLKAEEGITGLLLDDKGSTMKPPWTPDERIGSYPDMESLHFLDEVDGTAFEPKKLDMEGRAVVCDFG